MGNSQRGVFETAGPDGKRAGEGDRGTAQLSRSPRGETALRGVFSERFEPSHVVSIIRFFYNGRYKYL